MYRLIHGKDEETMEKNMMIGFAAPAIFPDSGDRLGKILLAIVAPELNVQNIRPSFDERRKCRKCLLTALLTAKALQDTQPELLLDLKEDLPTPCRWASNGAKRIGTW
jgi:hypothetical protein